MLLLIHNISDLRFSELMDVYRESNVLSGSELYPNVTSEIQLLNAEMDFYHYLRSVFFLQPDSFYAIWEAGGQYRAALRLEPYTDGMLLCGLETAPEARRQGFATTLIEAVIPYLRESNIDTIYSHVSKTNIKSLAVHQKCGFQILKDHAVYSDGSVYHNSYTMIKRTEKTEI